MRRLSPIANTAFLLIQWNPRFAVIDIMIAGGGPNAPRAFRSPRRILTGTSYHFLSYFLTFTPFYSNKRFPSIAIDGVA